MAKVKYYAKENFLCRTHPQRHAHVRRLSYPDKRDCGVSQRAIYPPAL